MGRGGRRFFRGATLLTFVITGTFTSRHSVYYHAIESLLRKICRISIMSQVILILHMLLAVLMDSHLEYVRLRRILIMYVFIAS